jgi:hypothetical protein
MEDKKKLHQNYHYLTLGEHQLMYDGTIEMWLKCFCVEQVSSLYTTVQ